MRTRFAAMPLLGLAVLVAACASGASSPSPAPATAAPATAAPATAAPSAAAGGAAALALADNALGKIVVDGKGMSLYVFTPDKGAASTCYDKCATSWPPLVTTGASTVGAGLTAGDLGTAARTDGATQVTFHGWPLYYFAGDAAAGETKGQGLSGKWYVVDATGAMVGAAAASEAPSAAVGGGVSIGLAETSLGKVLTGDKGMTLYLFTPDTSAKSACTGDCLANWPALISAAAPTLGAGLDAEDFKTITRDDGSQQVTFYGHPLYYFGGDKAAGDVAGQGLAGKWYVLKSDGTAVK